MAVVNDVTSRPRAGKGTWAKMLDLERKQKISRMYLSNANAITPLPTRATSLDIQSHTSTAHVQPPLQRPAPKWVPKSAAQVPPLSVSVPKSPVRMRIESTAEGIQTIVVQDDLELSDASSICHSPSWSDYGAGNKKKKEKREAERARKEAEKQLKKLEKKRVAMAQRELEAGRLKTKRLSKAPPLTLRPKLHDRSVSVPANPAAAIISDLESIAPAVHVTAGRFSFSRSGTTPASSPGDEASGFVGGLKLKNMQEAPVYMNTHPKESTANPESDQTPALSLTSTHSSSSPEEELSHSEAQNSFATADHNGEPMYLQYDSADDLDSEGEEGHDDSYHTFLTSVSIAPTPPGPTLSTTQSPISSYFTGTPATAPSTIGLRKSTKSGFFFRRSTDSSRNVPSVEPRSNSSGSARPGSRPSTAKSQNKADRILGELVAPESTSRASFHQEFSDSLGSSLSGSSLTDHSDGRASLEMQSNITTPTSSRPQSRQPPVNRIKNDNPVTRAPDHVHAPATKGLDYQLLAATTTVPEDYVSESLDRVPSLVRSHSTPVLPQEPASDLSFLPELKHQALIRPLLRSATSDCSVLNEEISRVDVVKGTGKGKGREVALVVPAQTQFGRPSSNPTSPTSSAYLRDARMSAPRLPSQLRVGPPSARNRRLSVGTSSRSSNSTPNENEPIAKMFVVCCHCKFFHDLPSKIYEAMANGPSVVQDVDLGVSGQIRTMVSCPWCNHGMSTDCCAGYSAIVMLKERFH